MGEHYIIVNNYIKTIYIYMYIQGYGENSEKLVSPKWI